MFANFFCNFVENLSTMKKRDGFKGERSLVLPQSVLKLIDNDPIVSSIYITDIGFYPNAKYHYRKRVDTIDEYVFIYCVDGRGWYIVNGHKYNVEKINILYCRQKYLTNMVQMRIIPGQFTGFILVVRLLNTMRPNVMSH